MKITVNRAELLDELKLMTKVSQRNSAIPILQHVRLEAVGESLSVSATDMLVSLTAACDCEVEIEGDLTVPAQQFLGTVRSLESEEISLAFDGRLLAVASEDSTLRLHTLAAEDFPNIPTPQAETVSMPFSTLAEMIRQTSFAISQMENRFQIMGARLRIEGNKVSMAGTDGHRLAFAENEIEGVSGDLSTLVPMKALESLSSLQGDQVGIQCGVHHIAFSVGHRRLVCRILEGTFPKLSRIMERHGKHHVKVDRKALEKGIQRVKLFTDRAPTIKVNLQHGQLELTAANPDIGDAVVLVPCECKTQAISMHLNANYILNVLASVDREMILIEVKDPNSQIMIPHEADGHRHLCLIMPVNAG